MSSLWIPESTPPQITSEAEEVVLGRVLGDGIAAVEAEGLRILRTDHEPLVAYLDRLGFVLNGLSTEGYWPDKVLKTAASISILAYRETGYFQDVDDDSFDKGVQIALLTGVPEAYAISLTLDSNLSNLLDTVREAPQLQESGLDPRQQGGYEQVASIGAGCVRHFLQQAIAA